MTTQNSFFEKYRRLDAKSLPRYVQLIDAIISAIEDGFWKQGEKLPAETELSRMTPFSLGTVQKALKALVDEGILNRIQGSGTFVIEKRRKMDRPWHCRFASNKENSFLPVFPKVVLKKRVVIDPPWAKLLQPDETGLIQIDRTIQIDNEFSVYCKMYLSSNKFSGFLKKRDAELEKTNFKTLIRRDYNINITHMSYFLRVTQLPSEICRAIEISKGSVGLIYEIIANSGYKNPIYYQELFIPPNNLRLHISDTANIPEYWAR
jgi:GntR family transcriptional regulator